MCRTLQLFCFTKLDECVLFRLFAKGLIFRRPNGPGYGISFRKQKNTGSISSFSYNKLESLESIGIMGYDLGCVPVARALCVFQQDMTCTSKGFDS